MNGTPIYSAFDVYIEAEINRKLTQRLEEFLKYLTETYPDFKDVINETIKKHMYPVQSVLRMDHEKQKRRKKQIDSESRCMARTGLDTQCRRPKLNGTRYCQSHSYSLPYNDIEHKAEVTIKVVKKRGRRGKCKHFDTAQLLENDRYIPAVIMEIGDGTYLVDQNDVVYNCNTNNEIVGYIKDEKVHWF
jgi:hypothetical protein